ncbi:SAM-dependent methyltransferase [Nocardiopsis sp. RSe5-2]|uniref:S-adenosyl-L-methionine-dependent methyltransferase n=1 Tax=Nocardiopsis endophytica TaxID=3018445 RepID=A0ABT4U1V5_9ACTN|nr:SAM-dependent methyltransferase [Nocardiopsis endophytica]MDA2810932.1 SAM-dependent methyltransferase [Nocardiopsis endophytica]
MPRTSETPDLPQALTGIGGTALGVALLRAQESRRPDRLFDDPFAERFLAAVPDGGSPWAADRTSGASSPFTAFHRLVADQVAVRTRFLDDALLAAARDGRTQVVLLASGMDTRAYRLDWPAGTTVYELDSADVLTFKRTVLTEQGAAPRCRCVEVSADLRQDWPEALAGAGFDPGRPTAWLAEGLLYALPSEGADLLLERITANSAPGGFLAFDHAEDTDALRAARAQVAPELVALWQGGPGEPGPWLAEHGWAPEVEDVAEAARGFGRPAPPAFDPDRPGSARGWLCTARLTA